MAQEKLVGQYRYESGTPKTPVYSVVDIELKADGTAVWTVINKIRDISSSSKASGSWTWQKGMATVRMDKSEEGQPLPAVQMSTFALRLAADGKTLLLTPDGSRFVRQD